MRNYILSIALLCAVLAGCAGPQQRQMQEMRDEIKVYSSAFDAKVNGDPSLAPLATKTTLRVADLKFDMLVITEKASDEEKPLIRKVAGAFFDMSSDILASMRRHEMGGQEYALFEGLYNGVGSLSAQLHNGELTWGQYNQKRKDLLTAFTRSHADLVAAVQERNEEAAYRAAALFQQTFTTLAIQRSAIQAAQPRVTICNRIGNAVYCN